MKKKFLKPSPVVKEVCQAFGLLINKAVKFTEASKYAIISNYTKFHTVLA